MIFLHQAQGVAHRLVLADGHRVRDHPVFGTLDLAHLAGLGGNAHVFVNHADSAFTGQGDGHGGFGHRIHGGRYNGNVQGYVPGEAGMEVYHTGQDF